jgi:hypothetical protein
LIILSIFGEKYFFKVFIIIIIIIIMLSARTLTYLEPGTFSSSHFV